MNFMDWPSLMEQGEHVSRRLGSGFASLSEAEDLINLFLALGCVACAAMAAGLTMGLVSLDEMQMEIKYRSGTDEERSQAAKVLPLIKRHHLLLVTLLLFNSLSNEALPIFLDALVPSYIAIVVSVSLVLIFGEIIPSALFTGPKQLQIASYCSEFTWLLITLFYPIGYPISRLLDYLLGHETSSQFSRAEFAALVEIQQMNTQSNQSFDTPAITNRGSTDLTNDEILIVQGVLAMARKEVLKVMIPIQDVFSLSMDRKLDHNTLATILGSGFSRIPVFEGKDKRNIRGILLVKKLIVVDSADSRSLHTIPLRTPVCVHADISLLDLLNEFQEGKSHLAVVSYNPRLTRERMLKKQDLTYEDAAPLGIITLEDVIEELLGEEILDEDDRAVERRALQKLKKTFLLHRSKMKARAALQHHQPAPTEETLRTPVTPLHGSSIQYENTDRTNYDSDVRPELEKLQGKGILPSIVRKYTRTQHGDEEYDPSSVIGSYQPPVIDRDGATFTAPSGNRRRQHSAGYDERRGLLFMDADEEGNT